MEKTTVKKEKKAKKEKKFNSERFAKQVKNSLKAIFPNDGEKFIVSSYVERVEVMYLDDVKCSLSEILMFNTIFCQLSGIKKEQLIFSKIIKAISTVK